MAATFTKANLKKEYRLRFLFRLLFALVSFVFPMVIVAIKFDIITQFNGFKLTVMGMLMLIITIWRFKNKLMEWINSWEYSIMKYILIGFSRCYIFILIVAILILAQKGLANLIFVCEWISVAEILSYTVIYPIEQRYDFIIKRELRKQETRETNAELLEQIKAELHK
jgi:hypothetical protein